MRYGILGIKSNNGMVVKKAGYRTILILIVRRVDSPQIYKGRVRNSRDGRKIRKVTPLSINGRWKHTGSRSTQSRNLLATQEGYPRSPEATEQGNATSAINNVYENK
jgi:hypothetical protein